MKYTSLICESQCALLGGPRASQAMLLTDKRVVKPQFERFWYPIVIAFRHLGGGIKIRTQTIFWWAVDEASFQKQSFSCSKDAVIAHQFDERVQIAPRLWYFLGKIVVFLNNNREMSQNSRKFCVSRAVPSSHKSVKTRFCNIRHTSTGNQDRDCDFSCNCECLAFLV